MKTLEVYETYDRSTLSDLLLLIATDVERSFIQGGLKAGEDYTKLDCFKCASKIVPSFIDHNTTYQIGD
jgi:hypothetical protein